MTSTAIDQTAEPAELLTPREAARRLHVTRAALASRRARGNTDLPFVRISTRCVRYRASDIDDFIARRTSGTAP